MKKYLSFDVGGTDVKHALIDENGIISNKIVFKTPKSMNELLDSITNIVKNYNEFVEGIALSLPGAVNDKLGIIGGASALPYLHGPNIKKLLLEKTGMPVYMENDANCAALGEVWLGAARDKKDILFLVIGTGVGGAIIKNGEIHSGPNLHGGEFGYMISDRSKDEILTLSDTGSTGGLIRRVENKLNLDRGSLNGKEIFEMAETGNKIAIKEINYFYKKLAEGIYNLQYSFDPEMIIIGGSISQRDNLIDSLYVELDNILKKITHATIRPIISPCYFRGDANLIGAVKYFMQKSPQT